MANVGRGRVECLLLTSRLVIDEHDGDILGHHLVYRAIYELYSLIHREHVLDTPSPAEKFLLANSFSMADWGPVSAQWSFITPKSNTPEGHSPSPSP